MHIQATVVSGELCSLEGCRFSTGVSTTCALTKLIGGQPEYRPNYIDSRILLDQRDLEGAKCRKEQADAPRVTTEGKAEATSNCHVRGSAAPSQDRCCLAAPSLCSPANRASRVQSLKCS